MAGTGPEFCFLKLCASLSASVARTFSVGPWPFVADWRQTRLGPISVHHPDFIIHESVISFQSSVVSSEAISYQRAAHMNQGPGTAGFLLNTDD
jgi:hypothetical protein